MNKKVIILIILFLVFSGLVTYLLLNNKKENPNITEPPVIDLTEVKDSEIIPVVRTVIKEFESELNDMRRNRAIVFITRETKKRIEGYVTDQTIERIVDLEWTKGDE